MSRLVDMAYVNGSRRYSRDLLEHPGAVLTEPWWTMPGLDQGSSFFRSTLMDTGTAEAISVMEKQMAEKDQKIAAMENTLKGQSFVISGLLDRVDRIETAIGAFAKGLGK